MIKLLKTVSLKTLDAFEFLFFVSVAIPTSVTLWITINLIYLITSILKKCKIKIQ